MPRKHIWTKDELGNFDKMEKAEKKRWEKVQRAIEKKDLKALDRWIKQFGEGKKDWLT